MHVTARFARDHAIEQIREQLRREWIERVQEHGRLRNLELPDVPAQDVDRIAGDAAGSKLTKANDLGVEVWDEARLIETLPEAHRP